MNEAKEHTGGYGLIQSKLNGVLAECDRKSIREDVILYLCNEKQLREILLLENSVRGMSQEDGTDKARKDPFMPFGKIINPKLPAYKYSYRTKHIYKNISDRTKILEEIGKNKEKERGKGKDKMLSIWENTERKNLNDHIEASNYDSIEADRLRRELEERIEEQKAYFKEVCDNFEDYEVVITNYENRKEYIVLYYTLSDGSTHNEYLRKDAPNILFYEEDKRRGQNRSDKKMQKIVDEYDRIFATFYVKKREE